jgi:hypothetical protein
VSDHEERALERLAFEGDEVARERLRAARTRRGEWDPTAAEFYHEVAVRMGWRKSSLLDSMLDVGP